MTSNTEIYKPLVTSLKSKYKLVIFNFDLVNEKDSASYETFRHFLTELNGQEIKVALISRKGCADVNKKLINIMHTGLLYTGAVSQDYLKKIKIVPDTLISGKIGDKSCSNLSKCEPCDPSVSALPCEISINKKRDYARFVKISGKLVIPNKAEVIS